MAAALIENWRMAEDRRLGALKSSVGPFVQGEVKGHPTIPDGTVIMLSCVRGRDGEEIITNEDDCGTYKINRGDRFTLGEMWEKLREVCPDAKERVLKSIQPCPQ